MNAYVEAREKAWDAIAKLLIEWNRLDGEGAEHPVIYDTGKIGRYTESPLFDAAVGTFLAALPPSIIVDGRVVELEKVADRYILGEHRPDESDGWDFPIGEFVEDLLDAAREVAGRESVAE